MKERPILFSSEMVRAILDGRKTQTRRVIKPQPEIQEYMNKPSLHWSQCGGRSLTEIASYCPYGQPGDRLWVRETWRKTFDVDDKDVMEYRAGGTRLIVGESIQHGEHRITSVLPKWKPSIFMPRWASRIMLEIVNIRVERVQDISEEDAIAEGCNPYDHIKKEIVSRDNEIIFSNAYQASYQLLWDSINAKRGYGWDVNPWVWVVEFKVLL